MRLQKYLIRTLVPVLLAPMMMWPATLAQADGEPIRVLSSSATSEFPEGIRFRAEVEGDNEITSVAVRFRIGAQTRGVFEYADFEKGSVVDGELFWRTNTAARYIPPGTIITYSFEIEDSAGSLLGTEPQQFTYHDARFQWEEVSQGPVTVAYHPEAVKPRAEIILDTMIQTLAHMGPLLGADTEAPIRVTMYNNVKEMLDGLPPGSTSIRRELITEGQAFTDIGTVLVLGGGGLAEGTASHELTHILTHRAGDSIFRRVPPWLDEGLSEYGNVQPGFSYDVALEFAVATNRLLPITDLQARPGTSEDVIIFYGQSRSIVKFMVDQFGPEKMKELMATLKSGVNINDSLERVYGVDGLGLENLWRDSIGAPEYVPPPPGAARPTPLPRPAVLPYSLTPQPQSVTIGATAETPTPEPQQADTPTPVPTATATATATPLPEASPTPETTQESPSGGGGGGCSRPSHGGPTALDLSAVAFMVGLVGLGVRRRIRL